MKALRLPIIFIFVVSLAACGTSAALYRHKGQEKVLRLAAEEKLEQQIRARVELEEEFRSQLETSEAARQLAQLQLAEKEGRISELEAEVSALREHEAELAGRASHYEEEMEELRKQFGGLSAHRENLAREVTETREEADNLRRQLQELRQTKQAIEERFNIAALAPVRETEGVELEKIVVKVQPESLSGRVLVVNREFDFIITNVGKRDELELGDFLEIVRDGASIGQVEVEKLYESMSAATIVSQGRAIDIREGDYVRKL